MMSIMDIAAKDLLQLLRDRKTFMFLLLMPLVFTFLFGFAFGGFGGGSDARLPVAFLDQDDHPLTHKLGSLLADSQVLRLVDYTGSHPEELEALVGEGKLAAAIIVPRGYGHELLFGRKARLALIADTATTAGMSVESEVLSRIIRLEGAVRAALLLEKTLSRKAPFNYTLQQALSRWQDPPIQVVEIPSAALKDLTASQEALSHTSPGMMLQFAIAGLLTCAQVLVAERRSRALQRLFTTAVPRLHILLGHTLAIYLLIICQFCLLMLFGQFALGVRYLNAPLAALLLALSAAACIACLGMLIGVQRRPGGGLFAGADVRFRRTGWCVGAAGGGWTGFPNGRTRLPARLGDGRLQQHPAARARLWLGACAIRRPVGVCTAVLQPGSLALLAYAGILMVGTRQPSIARLENDSSRPSLSFPQKVAEALHARV